MKNYYIFLITAFISYSTFGQAIFDDNFDYGEASGDLVSIASGFWFTQSATVPSVGYQTESITLNNYEYLARGGSATIDNSADGEDINTGFGAVNSGTVYYSALVNLTSLGSGNAGFFMHFNGATGVRGRVFAIDNGAGKINFGITSLGTPDFISTAYDLNTTYLIVVSYNITTYASNLYVLTAPLQNEPGSPDATQSSVAGPTEVSSISIRQRTDGPAGAIDNIRVATTWGDLMQTYFNPAIDGSDMPKNGSSLTIDPGTAASATVFFNTVNFVASNDIGGCTSDDSEDGYISWELEDTSDNSKVYGCIFNSDLNTDVPIPGMIDGKTYVFTAQLVDNSGVPLTNPEAVYSLTIEVIPYIDVADINALRGVTIDENIFYRVTEPNVVLSYFNGEDPLAGGNPLYFFQDNSGGIVVTDESGFMPSIAVGDVFDTLRGNLKTGPNGELMLEITNENRANPTQNNGDVTPQPVNLDDLNTNYTDYESELVLINDVDFVSPSGDFVLDTNYAINDGTRGSNDMFLADFGNADYIVSSTPVPVNPVDLVVLVRSNVGGVISVTARSSSDFSLGTYDISQKELNLYPNPTSLGYVNISGKNQSNFEVSIFDILGKQIKDEVVSNGQLNLAHLKAGVYVLKIKQDDSLITKKLIIE